RTRRRIILRESIGISTFLYRSFVVWFKRPRILYRRNSYLI
ncbi:hypothetical protein ACN38_g7353, partial [Penicillium nordicum]